jgi:hypothetical protein
MDKKWAEIILVYNSSRLAQIQLSNAETKKIGWVALKDQEASAITADE